MRDTKRLSRSALCSFARVVSMYRSIFEEVMSQSTVFSADFFPSRSGRVLMRILSVAVLFACVFPASLAAVDTVDDANYKKEVEDSALPVFVDFYAVWCAPCKKVSPIVDELATEYSGKIKFVRVDVDKAPKTAEKFNAEQLPTLVLLSKKMSKGVSITGYHTKDDLKTFIENSLKKVQ
jgi:thioredoxin 1